MSRGLARAFAGLIVFAAAGISTALPPAAQEMKFFRIGTGGTAGTYFPIGGLIANAVSAPPGSRPCRQGGACGVPGLVAIAIATNGTEDNLSRLMHGQVEAALAQSDLASWAHAGNGIYNDRPRIETLRAIGNLYPETVHLVARREAAIASVADLKGKRVSLDERGSGTLIDARMILEAFGLSESDIRAEYLKPDAAGRKLKAGELDAFFFVGGAPVGAVAKLAREAAIDIVPITGARAEQALTRYSFFSWDSIPNGTYEGIGLVQTISVNALLVTTAAADEKLIHGVTEALWNANTRKLLDTGHAKGRLIRKETAADGLGIPLHPGAERYYREAGLLPAAR